MAKILAADDIKKLLNLYTPRGRDKYCSKVFEEFYRVRSLFHFTLPESEVKGGFPERSIKCMQ
jgi:hypothetical protein